MQNDSRNFFRIFKRRLSTVRRHRTQSLSKSQKRVFFGSTICSAAAACQVYAKVEEIQEEMPISPSFQHKALKLHTSLSYQNAKLASLHRLATSTKPDPSATEMVQSL